jgi:hypothetical protein
MLSYRHMLFDWLKADATHCMGGAEALQVIEESQKWERSSELQS